VLQLAHLFRKPAPPTNETTAQEKVII
jgi:hypothetical protein